MSCWNDSRDSFCCDKERVIECDKLCAEHGKFCWIKSKKIWTYEEVANDICSQSVTANQMIANNGNFNSLCAPSATINNLCVDNLTVSNQQICNKYRATAVLSSNLLYTLGGNINWNMVLDDPNGNMSAGAYTVPKTGYYNLSFTISMVNLAGAATIVGIPVSVLQVNVNAKPFRADYASFLSFNPAQASTFSSLVLLNAGDIVTCVYNVQVVDPVTGLGNYVGSVSLEGNGTFPDQSSFGIILMSELCLPQPGDACPVCPTVVVPCGPVIPPRDCDEDNEPEGMEGNPPVMPSASALRASSQAACAPCQPAAAGSQPVGRRSRAF